jgi:hypothetical protein
MSDISEVSLTEQPPAFERMAEPRRDKIISIIAAAVASLAIHAVLIFGGYLVYNTYVTPLTNQSHEVLFSAQTEEPLPPIAEPERRDLLQQGETTESSTATVDIAALDTSSSGAGAMALPEIGGENLPDIPVYTPGFGLQTTDNLFGRPEDLGGVVTTEGFGSSRGTGGEVLGGTGTVEGIGQLFSSRLQEGFQGKDLLLVWLVDASASLYDKIGMLKGRVQPLFDTLNKENPKKLDMTVVSFDSSTKLELAAPTADPAAITLAMDTIKERSFNRFKKKALEKIAKPDLPTTRTPLNTMQALRFAADPANLNLKEGEERQIVIVLLTDEKGSDTVRWSEAFDALKKRKIPLYVFGPTTRMVSETKSELLLVRDPSIPPVGVALVNGVGDLGSAEPVREPVCRNWGVGMFGVNFEEPTTAGPFELSMLVKLTGGKYYFVDDMGIVDPATAGQLPANAQAAAQNILGERQYNSAGRFSLAAMGQYMPKYDSEEINAFMRSFGTRFLDLVVEFEKIPKPPASFASTEDLRKALRTASDDIRAINVKIKQVESLKVGPEVPPRWAAHRDLFLAQLCYARYTLNEYVKALEEFANTEFSPKPDAEGFIHYYALSPVPVAAPTITLDPVNSVEFFTWNPVEAVIKSDQELKDFVKANAALGENQELPKVDFNTQMLVLVSLGKAFSPEARIEILAVTQTKDALEVAVDKNTPLANTDENTPYFPNRMVIVPASPLAPKFLPYEKWSEERAAEETGLLKGGKLSAGYRQDAKAAISRVIRFYRGTPWEAVASQMLPLNSVKLEEVKFTPQAPPPGNTDAPGLPGDF